MLAVNFRNDMKRLPKQLRAQRGNIKRFARIPGRSRACCVFFSVWRQFGWAVGHATSRFAPRGVPCENDVEWISFAGTLVWL